MEHVLISFFQTIMLVNGRSFDISTLYLDTYRRLITTFGDIHWLPEFEPMRFPNRHIILRLLYLFHCHRCFMSGFSSFLVGRCVRWICVGGIIHSTQSYPYCE